MFNNDSQWITVCTSESCRSELEPAPQTPSSTTVERTQFDRQKEHCPGFVSQSQLLLSATGIRGNEPLLALSKVWLRVPSINTSVQPHCGIWLILTHISLSNLFFLQDYLYLTFTGAGLKGVQRVFNLSPTDLREWNRNRRKYYNCFWKSSRKGRGDAFPTARSDSGDDGAERRWITRLEILQVDWSTSVCVTAAEQLVHLPLMIWKPPNHLIQEAPKLQPAGGFVHGNLKARFRQITW